jgi:hypothetical protein
VGRIQISKGRFAFVIVLYSVAVIGAALAALAYTGDIRNGPTTKDYNTSASVGSSRQN